MIEDMLRPGTTLAELYHQQYQRQATRRAFYRTSDRLEDDNGTRYVDAKDGEGKAILPKHDREEEIDYQIRRDQTVPEQHTRQITDHYVSHVFRSEPTISEEHLATLAPLLTDADGYGTSLPKLINNTARDAFLELVSYLLVDSTATGEEESAADPTRYVIRQITADQVINWQDLPNGQPSEAIILVTDEAGVTYLWAVNDKVAIRADLDLKPHQSPSGGTEITEVYDPIPHTYGKCPLVRMIAPRVIPGVADGQRRIAWIASLLGMEETDATISQYYIAGDGIKVSDTQDMVKSARRVWVVSANGAKVGVVGADPDQAESLRISRKDERETLNRGAKVMPITAQGAPESGIARAYRFVDAEVELAAFADAIEDSINNALEMWAAAEGVSDAPVYDYPDDFSPVDREAVLKRLILVEASNLPDEIKLAERIEAVTILYPKNERIRDSIADGLSSISDVST